MNRGPHRMAPYPDVWMRPGRRSDHALVYRSWLEALANDSDFRSLPRPWFYGLMHLAIKHMLETCELAVCFNPSDDEHAIGFVVYSQPDVLHWIYVKDDLRRARRGRRMLAAVFGDDQPLRTPTTTHRVRFVRDIWPPGVEVDPRLIGEVLR